MTFNHVNVPQSGQYQIVIYYSTAQTAEGALAANRSNVVPIVLTSTGFGTAIGTATARVRLEPGDNSIQFSSQNAPGLLIDKIEVWP